MGELTATVASDLPRVRAPAVDWHELAATYAIDHLNACRYDDAPAELRRRQALHLNALPR